MQNACHVSAKPIGNPPERVKGYVDKGRAACTKHQNSSGDEETPRSKTNPTPRSGLLVANPT